MTKTSKTKTSKAAGPRKPRRKAGVASDPVILDPETTGRLLAAATRDAAERVRLGIERNSRYASLFRAVDALKPGQCIAIPGTEDEVERARNSILVRAKRSGTRRFSTRRIDGALLVIRTDDVEPLQVGARW